MSLGAARAGITPAFAVDKDPHAVETYRQNHPETACLCGDVRSLTPGAIRRHLPKRRPHLLFGGPPCQGFSFSNLRTRRRDNPENWLFLEMLRLARGLEPEWVVIENVQGLKNTEGGLFFNRIREGLEELGYAVVTHLLNAQDYGVPQDRTRLFIIGSREGVHLQTPRRLKSGPTVRDAIADLPPLSNGASVDVLPYRGTPSRYARFLRGKARSSTGHLVSRNAPFVIRRYRHIPPGGNWEDVPRRLMHSYDDISRCHTGIYHRLKWAEPSIVIGNYRKNMLIHPAQDRGLSVREAARLQSFPDAFRFAGSIGIQQQQVANAVPPFLAAAVIKEIRRIGN